MTSKPLPIGLVHRLENARHDYIEALTLMPTAADFIGVLETQIKSQEIAKWGMVEAVIWARGHGATWQQIADVLRITRQAAQQKFGSFTIIDVRKGYKSQGIELI